MSMQIFQGCEKPGQVYSDKRFYINVASFSNVVMAR